MGKMQAKSEGQMFQMENTSCATGLRYCKCSLDSTMLKDPLAKDSLSDYTSHIKDGPVGYTKQHLIRPTVEKHGYLMTFSLQW